MVFHIYFYYKYEINLIFRRLQKFGFHSIKIHFFHHSFFYTDSFTVQAIWLWHSKPQSIWHAALKIVSNYFTFSNFLCPVEFLSKTKIFFYIINYLIRHFDIYRSIYSCILLCLMYELSTHKLNCLISEQVCIKQGEKVQQRKAPF